MTTFSGTWNTAFEALPTDTEDARQGADRIRVLKRDIRERLEVDHSMAGDGNDGAHIQVTFLEQAGNPPTLANTGYLFTKDVAGVTELFWKDSAGNVLQITAGGASGIPAFPAGTKMLFQQTAAPTGWTKITTDVNDKALRVVSGSVVNGGSVAFSTLFGRTATDAHTLTTGEIPPHAHSFGASVPTTSPGGVSYTAFGGISTITQTATDGGGGGGHSHNIDMRVQYLDVIVASKD